MPVPQPSPGSFVPRDDPGVLAWWSKNFYREVARKGPLTNTKLGIAGKNAWNGVMVNDDLSVRRGGRVVHQMFYQLSGRGRVGVNEPQAGHREGIKKATWEHYVDLFRHGVKVESMMHAQLVNWDDSLVATDGIATWADKRYETAAALQLSAYAVVTDPAYAMNSLPPGVAGSPIRAIHPDYIARPNGKAHAGLLGPGDELSMDFVNEMAHRIDYTDPPIAPMKLPNGDWGYLWNVSRSDQAQMLATNSQFYAIMQKGLEGGKLQGNPLFSGRLIGKINRFYFVVNPYVPPGLNATGAGQMVPNTSRGFILAAQGLCIGFGRGDAPSGFGLEHRYMIVTGTDDVIWANWDALWIAGMDRPGFIHPDEKNTPGVVPRELGCIVVETYSKLPSNFTTAAKYDEAYAPWVAMGVPKTW